MRISPGQNCITSLIPITTDISSGHSAIVAHTFSDNMFWLSKNAKSSCISYQV